MGIKCELARFLHSTMLHFPNSHQKVWWVGTVEGGGVVDNQQWVVGILSNLRQMKLSRVDHFLHTKVAVLSGS